MDENPYRSPEYSGRVQTLPLSGRRLLAFYVGGWLSVLAGMAISFVSLGKLIDTLLRLGGVTSGNGNSRLFIVIGMLLIPIGTLAGGWLAGRVYRRVYGSIASKNR